MDPDQIHTPGIYVDAIVKREYDLPIEKMPKDPKKKAAEGDAESSYDF